MPKTQSFLLQILVGVNPPNNILSYLDSSVRPDPLSVNVGDEVGFLVQVVLPNGRQTPPYTLTFSDPSFFGVSSLNVPAGGTSPFLRVLSLLGKVKYSLDVTGLGAVLDPEIQSGGEGFPFGTARTPNHFVFTWDVGGQTATYTENGAPVPYSTPVSRPDTVEFTVINAGGAVQNFAVTFQPNLNQPTHWASPFDPNQSTFAAPQASPTDIGPLEVIDQVDTGKAFPFTASVTVNNQAINLPAAINPYIQM
jgi:hypothetical protein